MSDSSLTELLRSLQRVNELSKEAIDELNQFLEKNVEVSSDINSIIGKLTTSISSLNEEAVGAKNLHHRLLTDKTQCSERSALTEVAQKVGENVTEESSNCINNTEDLIDKVLNNSTKDAVDIVEEVPKVSSDELDKDQNECNAEPSSTKDDLTQSEVVDNKPLLKIVDFNKLVDPRNLELMDKNEKRKETNGNKSIIVLSSSDDEPIVTKKLQKQITNSKQNTKKNSKENVDISTSGVASDNEPIATNKSQKTKKKNINKSKGNSVENVHISTTEVASDDELKATNKSQKTITKNLSKSKENSIENVLISTSGVPSTSCSSSKNRTNSVTEVEEAIQIGNITIKSSHNDYMAIKNDKKFSSKPYVRLLRIPCDEMKNFYLNKQEKDECEKDSERKSLNNYSGASDSNSIKTKKKTSQYCSESDSDQNEKEKNSRNNKRKLRKKSKKTSFQENSDSSEEESEKTLKRNSKKSHDRKKNGEKKCSESTEKTKKSKYVLSDDDDKNSASEGSGKELENSNKSVGKKTSREKGTSEDSENENDEEPKKNSSEGENKKSTGSDDEVVEIRTENSNSDQSSQEKKNDSDEQIVINSDDSENSDFDTFFKKNKLARNVKKIKTDSEDEANQEDKVENVESGKDGSQSENLSDKEEDEGIIRKRKRIMAIENDSSESDGAVTRKKIKKVISRDSLSVKTKKAAAEERERKQRILEKQKKYNQIYESTDLANSKVDKLVLDVDEETEQPLLEVDKALVTKLKPHQASGIQFMWDACFESIKRIEKSQGSGCILAHCMGLGKTLQVIALTNTLLEEDKTKVKKVLIVTPLSTVLNWKAEFKNWLSGEESYEIYELVSVKAQNAERACYIREWHENGGVMIISYAMFRNLSNEKNRKISKKIRSTFFEGLVNPGPDIVICDEGHLLKNEKTGLSIAMNKIKTRRRIVLTGTPLQNNLKEYYCMVQFVKPNLLGTYKEYLNRFVNPITNGQYTDSTQYDINVMRRRSHVLHKLLDGIVQRRDYSVLSPYLPPKHEYVLFLTLSDTQRKLYKHYMDHLSRKAAEDGSSRTSFLFKDFQEFSRICIHPRVLLDKSNDDQLKYQSDEESIGSLKDFIDDDEESSSSTSESSGSESNSDSKKKKKHVSKRVTRAQKNNPTCDLSSEEEVEVKKEWWQEYCDGDELDNIAHSTKLLLLFEILKECEQIGDKVLLFSQSLYALNLIEYFLEKVDEATQNGDADKKTCGYTGSWSPGLDYFRLDGSTNCSLRSEWCDAFNKEGNSRARLFLLSTKAGGLGINLVAANRVILFDVSWNPSSDVQSIYRVYRFGQLKPSFIYRFVTYGTMEMKIYERQVTKQAISKRVIDEQQIDRHYNQNDLAELYKFEEPDLDVRPTPLVPKDVLLGEMLINHEDKIYKYHEHQTLLENKEDEILNEEERKAAWDEFENEKVERTKQPLIGKFSVNTVQLALRSIIQRDNPTWNNNQILSIIPQLIQQLNLQLSLGDQTMYNRIAAEIKIMQDEYARKMQLQFYQYRLQLAQNQMQSMFQPQFPMMNAFGNRMPPPNGNFNPSGSGFNPNEVVDLN